MRLARRCIPIVSRSLELFGDNSASCVSIKPAAELLSACVRAGATGAESASAMCSAIVCALCRSMPPTSAGAGKGAASFIAVMQRATAESPLVFSRFCLEPIHKLILLFLWDEIRGVGACAVGAQGAAPGPSALKSVLSAVC